MMDWQIERCVWVVSEYLENRKSWERDALWGCHYQDEKVETPVKDQVQMMSTESAGTRSPKSELEKEENNVK